MTKNKKNCDKFFILLKWEFYNIFCVYVFATFVYKCPQYLPKQWNTKTIQIVGQIVFQVTEISIRAI